MANFWYGIPDVEFIWHGEWADPELRYGGIVSKSANDLEDFLYEHALEYFGREPNAKEFAEYMYDEGDYVKYALANVLVPPDGVDESVVNAIDFHSSFPGTYDLQDVLDKIYELRKTTIIPDSVWDKVYKTFAKYDDMDEATDEAQQVLIDEVTNPENYET